MKKKTSKKKKRQDPCQVLRPHDGSERHISSGFATLRDASKGGQILVILIGKKNPRTQEQEEEEGNAARAAQTSSHW